MKTSIAFGSDRHYTTYANQHVNYRGTAEAYERQRAFSSSSQVDSASITLERLGHALRHTFRNEDSPCTKAAFSGARIQHECQEEKQA
ncbi:hypothetical protein PROFUN_09914 [Planoprotostelium fungivorum]|uniref:Uncharacterized protein n=1 Tax=Planoprotostelium fungivorum TaxID=1890364 RepID=A0A2P6NG77_9EUKA|nr:hypothetical protein PROFUN_09914 [Planoprotostelium fungivorum]